MAGAEDTPGLLHITRSMEFLENILINFKNQIILLVFNIKMMDTSSTSRSGLSIELSPVHKPIFPSKRSEVLCKV